jgi:hypothetical protein
MNKPCKTKILVTRVDIYLFIYLFLPMIHTQQGEISWEFFQEINGSGCSQKQNTQRTQCLLKCGAIAARTWMGHCKLATGKP